MLYNFPEEEEPQSILLFGITVIGWLTDWLTGSENHIVCVFASVAYAWLDMGV